jgi:hypothetical protein
MKRTEPVFSWLTSVCLAVLVLLFTGSIQNALAQTCGYWMHPQYSTYSNASTDGTYIYTTVTLSGTTTGTCPYSCGSECYATHTPGVYNKIGDVGGSQGGSAQPWNHYLNVVNNKQIAATPGTEYYFWGLGQVTCSIEGTFYTSYVIPEYYALKRAVGVNTGYQVVTSSKFCSYSPDCSNGVTPACPVLTVQVPADNPCPTFWKAITLAYKYNQSDSWSCDGGIAGPAGGPGVCDGP